MSSPDEMGGYSIRKESVQRSATVAGLPDRYDLTTVGARNIKTPV